jgi:hypothetical protein
LRASLLLASAALVGCSAVADRELEVVFDLCAPLALDAAGASPEQQASLDDAVALWRARGAADLRAAPASDAAAVLPVVFAVAGPALHGYYDDAAGVLYVNARLEDRQARAIVIAHELGHAFGLWHVEAAERPSVMNRGNLRIAPTEADQRAAEAIWGRCGGAPPFDDTAY